MRLMSLATHTPLAGAPGDSLAAFLATVPAAADYDLDEMTQGPRAPHRPSRRVADDEAIAQSIEDAS